MGRARNKRVNPNHGKIHLTQHQLNVRAAVSMKKALDAVIVMSECVGKGPAMTICQPTPNSVGSLSLLAGWRFRSEDGNDQPDLMLELTPRLGLEKGDVQARDHISDGDFPGKAEVREQVADAMAKIQIELTDSEQKDIEKAIKSPWLGGAPR